MACVMAFGHFAAWRVGISGIRGTWGGRAPSRSRRLSRTLFAPSSPTRDSDAVWKAPFRPSKTSSTRYATLDARSAETRHRRPRPCSPPRGKQNRPSTPSLGIATRKQQRHRVRLRRQSPTTTTERSRTKTTKQQIIKD